MAETYALIQSATLTGSQATVTFSSIPQFFTDLVLRISARQNASLIPYAPVFVSFNGLTGGTQFYDRRLYTDNNTSVNSDTNTAASKAKAYYVAANGATSNVFGSMEIYIPSYGSTENKSFSSFGVTETNSTGAGGGVGTHLFSYAGPITSIEITSSADYLSGSTFQLYGIKNS